MLQSLRSAWRRWRESRRQYRIERAIYKASQRHAPENLDLDKIHGPIDPSGGGGGVAGG
jgi:hypothetical protein